MSVKRWQLTVGVLTTLTVVLLCAWIVLHQRQTVAGYSRLTEQEQTTEATLDALGLFRAEVEDAAGVLWVLVSAPEETQAEFNDRVQRVVFGGEENLGPCWESDCRQTTPPFGPYHIKLCAPDQATLDVLVADWCADHDCDNCP